MTKEDILSMLTDEDVARVSVAEGAGRLDEGMEFVDLEHLDRGVQKADRNTAADPHVVVPRKAVSAETWSRIEKALAA